jgi:hypothetical protein
MAIMRGITLSLMVVLAMSSVALGQVTLDYSCTDYNPGAGYKTYTVTVTGTNITALADFDVTGVHQVWTTDSPIDGLTPWSGDDAYPVTAPEDGLDSCVLFGDERLPDWRNNTNEPDPPIENVFVTAETIVGTPVASGDYFVGVGTLENLFVDAPGEDPDTYPDAYVKWGNADGVGRELNLLQLVVPDGEQAHVSVKILTMSDPADVNTIAEHDLTIDVNCVLDGDADSNGVVNLLDFTTVLANYDKTEQEWVDGDFDGNGEVNLLDFTTVLANYDLEASWYSSGGEASAAPVPEPGTVMMLVLGSLCLLGYRLRK